MVSGKNTKRKHKRKAQLSRAADAELAEICLEQQVLREMILPQQPAENNARHRDAKRSSALRTKPVVSSTVSSVSCCCSVCA